MPPDFDTIKTRQQAAWASGDYAVVGTTLQIVGESLCEALDLEAGSHVIDIAAGNGNATLAAARRFCSVVSTDYVPSLLDKGRERAAAERLAVDFRIADAEALPFGDGEFDVALSVFGSMFTPQHARAAAEMARVTRVRRPDRPRELDAGRLHRPVVQDDGQARAARGRAEVTGAVGHRGAPARNLRRVDRELSVTRKQFAFRYRSADHFLGVFRSYYGPVHKAFAALPADKQRRSKPISAPACSHVAQRPRR